MGEQRAGEGKVGEWITERLHSFFSLDVKKADETVSKSLGKYSANTNKCLTLCTQAFAFRKNSSTVFLSFRKDMLSM